MKVGVVGAGQMGCGIAHVAALASHDVLLFDNVAGVAEQAVTNIHANLTRQAARQIIVESSVKPALEHIQVVDSLADLGDCDLVIEAASENEAVKISIYQELCPFLRPDTVLATNTSSISVTRLAAATDRPERFIGIHFMNPVPMMELVELIRGIATDQPTYELALEFAIGLGTGRHRARIQGRLVWCAAVHR